jgi:hypothetical protein
MELLSEWYEADRFLLGCTPESSFLFPFILNVEAYVRASPSGAMEHNYALVL